MLRQPCATATMDGSKMIAPRHFVHTTALVMESAMHPQVRRARKRERAVQGLCAGISENVLDSSIPSCFLTIPFGFDFDCYCRHMHMR